MSRESKSSGGGLSVKTLLIAGASSAAATVIVPLLWRPGTLFAAAMTPIIVALVSEAINRPVEKVSSVTVKKTSRYTAAARRPVPDREETFDPLAPPTADELARLNQDLGAAPPPPPPPPRRRDDRRMGLTGRQWRIGLVTGLVAFVAAGAVVTASELAIFGDSVAGGRDRTSLFGGSSRNSDDATPAEEEQEKQRQQEENASPTPTPSATETPEDEEATPTPTATPTATPVPEQEAVPQETPAPSTQTAPTPAPTPAP